MLRSDDRDPDPGDSQEEMEAESSGEQYELPRKNKFFLWLPLPAVILVTLPWVYVRLSGLEVPDPTAALLSGVAILGAAFMLGWAAEVVQLDVSQGLAMAAVALIAVLPEYAVDMYFAWTAAQNPVYTHYAVANMTGGNRLLLGLGWPLLVFLWWLRTRKPVLEVHKERRVELSFLAIATMYAFVLPVKQCLSLVDTFVFLAIFAWYITRTATGRHVEPELVGPAEAIADMPPCWRRFSALGLFAYAAFVILLATKPFAEALLGMGKHFGIDEFLLVQWVAPLASEAPEFAVAALFVFRCQPDMALGTLLSSKVNQWTLLVGMLPATYSIASLAPVALPLDARQTEEVLLTAAQSVLGFVVLTELKLSWFEALLLFGLFAGQLLTPSVHARQVFAMAYLAISVVWLLSNRRHRQGCVKCLATIWIRRPRDQAPSGM